MRRLLALAFALCLASGVAGAQSLSGGVSVGATAGGDLSGTLPNPTVAKVNGSTPGGSCGANTFATSLSTSAVPTCTQPAQTNLSDYVATTWTPVLAGSSTAGTPTYTIQFGSYEKIGRQVTVRFNIAISAWSGTPAGNVTITGLPQTAGATANDNGVCVMSQFGGLTLTGNFAIGGNIQPSGTTINMVVATSASGAANMPVADWPTAAAASIQGSCSYHT